MPNAAVITTILLITLLAAAGGCESMQKTDKPDDLVGTWHFEAITSDGETTVGAPVIHFIPKITFEPIGEYEEEGRVTGFTGVNRFFGNYVVIESALELSEFGSTRMAGPPERMELETALLESLGTVSTYRADRERLELDFDAGTIVFTRVIGG